MMARLLVTVDMKTALMLIACLGLNIALAAPSDDFVTTWRTDNPGTSNDTSITVPMVGGPFDVDWDNDGTFDDFGLSGSVTHDYGIAGTYTIRIAGSYDSIRFGFDAKDPGRIISLDQWGTQSWTTMRDAFNGAGNLQVPATDVPDFSRVTSMRGMFKGATSANPDTSGWDTSSVTDMNHMFAYATSANPDTSGWDTSAVTDMAYMFIDADSANPDTSGWDTSAVTDMRAMFGAESANPDTSGWDTSAVTDMGGMFGGATSANPDTSGWDTSAVTDMQGMFFDAAAANPDTSGWDTSAVTGMSQMFSGATTANPDTSGWDTSAVTDMAGMFTDAHSANPDTSGWDTSAVTVMQAMFYGATSANPDTSAWDTGAVYNMRSMFSGATSANPDTSGWDTSAVTFMSAMFKGATSANPDTSGWDTSAVTDMAHMFADAVAANPDTSGWDTSAVTDMSEMFRGAISFDQDIGSWDVTSLTDASYMFHGISLSTANYESLLIGWDAQTLQAGVEFSGGNSTYCAAAAVAARANMIASDSWDITDGGVCSEILVFQDGFEDPECPCWDEIELTSVTAENHDDNNSCDTNSSFPSSATIQNIRPFFPPPVVEGGFSAANDGANTSCSARDLGPYDLPITSDEASECIAQIAARCAAIGHPITNLD